VWVESTQGVGSCFHFVVQCPPVGPAASGKSTLYSPDNREYNREYEREDKEREDKEREDKDHEREPVASSESYPVIIVESPSTTPAFGTPPPSDSSLVSSARSAIPSPVPAVTSTTSTSTSPKRRILPARRRQISSSNFTVLFVEDEMVNRKSGERVLARANYNGILAKDGLEALGIAAARYGDLHCVVTDIQMPHLDGIGLARELRSRGNDVPIIALSANTSSQDRQLCMDAGITDFQPKPFDTSDFLECVSKHCRSRLRQGGRLIGTLPEDTLENKVGT